MKDNQPYIPIEAQRSVFGVLRYYMLNLMAVKSLKIIFENFYDH